MKESGPKNDSDTVLSASQAPELAEKGDTKLEQEKKEVEKANAEKRAALGKNDPGHKSRYWDQKQSEMREGFNNAYKDLALNPPQMTPGKDPNVLLGELIAWVLMMLLGGVAMGLERGLAEGFIKAMQTVKNHDFNKVSKNLGEMKEVVEKRNECQSKLDTINKELEKDIKPPNEKELLAEKQKLEKEIKAYDENIKNYNEHITGLMQSKHNRDTEGLDTKSGKIRAEKFKFEDSKQLAVEHKKNLELQMKQAPTPELAKELEKTDAVIKKIDEKLEKLEAERSKLESKMESKDEKRAAQQQQLDVNMQGAQGVPPSGIRLDSPPTFTPMNSTFKQPHSPASKIEEQPPVVDNSKKLK